MNFAATDNKIRTNKASQVAANEEQTKQNEDTDIVPNRQVNEMTDSSLADISEMTDSLYKNEEKRGNIEEKQLLALLDYAEKKSDKKANKKRSWSFGALFGSNGISGLSSINESNNGDASSSATVQPVDSVHNNDTKEMTRAGEFYLPQNSQSPILDAKNHRSWSFGVSVQKQLSTHLAIESGLVYTLLTSDIVIQANNNAKEVSQSLHYLGIPLKLNCLLANPRNWNFYVGVGAMLEYCVNGSRDGISLSMSDRWQWSAKANLGVQYNFSKLVGIYIEPGVNYFISTNKTIPTLRTQQPFSFNLNAGVRFNLK